MPGLRTRIELKGIFDLLKSFDRDRVLGTIHGSVNAGLSLMTRDVVLNRLSGQYLNVVTGTARRSIRQGSRRLRDRVLGEFGSPELYVRAHELGFSGRVSVPAHSVRTHPVKSHTRRDGSSVRAHTRSAHSRGPLSRQMSMRARRFLRDSLRAGVGPLSERIKRDLLDLARSGGKGE